MNNAPLPGKVSTRHFMCSCCIAPAWRKTLKRNVKRRERQAWKRDVRLNY